ncbi:hypothetical protein HMPREF1986_02840 [Oribacterium sp. oral taxon 078 str. F0263]|nr:hypothetical protein HMPREF1986_02840 [Oribacterium sp. oral taxon 078 str. F0263]
MLFRAFPFFFSVFSVILSALLFVLLPVLLSPADKGAVFFIS